jgi:hypothetical protein
MFMITHCRRDIYGLPLLLQARFGAHSRYQFPFLLCLLPQCSSGVGVRLGGCDLARPVICR